MWARRCANPSCQTEITACFGTTKAGDMQECWDGLRPREKIRELCAFCATYLTLTLSSIPPQGWSPYFAAFGWGYEPQALPTG